MNFEVIFRKLEDEIKAKIPGVSVFWGENDMRSGVRLVLEFAGLYRKILKFNLKVASNDAFSVMQAAKVAALEWQIQTLLPFNTETSSKGNRADCGNFEYYLTHTTDTADRTGKETVNYSRSFDLTLNLKD